MGGCKEERALPLVDWSLGWQTPCFSTTFRVLFKGTLYIQIVATMSGLDSYIVRYAAFGDSNHVATWTQ